MVILGIDPGSVRAGYGVIQSEGSKLFHLQSGLLSFDPKNKNKGLGVLENHLTALIKKFRPERVGIEKLFFIKNKKTAMEVAQARGVLVNAVIKSGVRLIELSPPQIKLAVTGNGNASKQAVAKMVRFFLPMEKKELVDDVTDALAIAIATSSVDKMAGVDI